MSKQDLRDEQKETEGSTESKARIRRLIRSLGRRRMLRDVKTATAVVVNPTHFAVALRYEPQAAGAPRVVAKGKNYLALRIRALAEESGVSVVENPPLARSLYSAVEVGQEIPAHLYRAVAEVLAHVYKLLNSYGAARNRQ
jgi:flagellar biosynthetic protein FlhB